MSTFTKPHILDHSPEELATHFKQMGLEPYRANQIFEWIFEKGIYDFDSMTNLSLPVRKKLKAHFDLSPPNIVKSQRSSDDRSVKLLLKLPSKDLVETVVMPVKNRQTVCVSSQVGCKFHCAFCASGQDGFFRSLNMGEILWQILMARDASRGKKITHIVFMGIGEPFDNYTQLLKTIRTLNSSKTLHIGARRITVSTCGIVPKINQFSREGLQIELSISLHGPNDDVRGAVMPVNKAYPLKALIPACQKYAKATKRAITFEYILIKGVNSAQKHAQELGRLLKGMLCKVNLIPYNPIKEFPHAAPTYKEVVHFQKTLQSMKIKTTVRFSKGQDIQAACGQLRSVQTKGKS